MSLIDDILRNTADAVQQARAAEPLAELQRRLRDAPPVRPLSQAFREFGLIAEIKERSPSGGNMAQSNLDDAQAAYLAADTVVGISVLTQARYFGGSLERLQSIRGVSTKPVLRKDFIFDEYQVYQARAYGADAILLMAGLPLFESNTGRQNLGSLFALATDLGMDCLCEIGMASATETPADAAQRVPGQAAIWGINSREFKSSDLTVHQRHHEEFRALIPAGKIAIAESGIHTAQDIEQVGALGYDGALIGTAFLKGPRTVHAVLDEFAVAVRKIRSQRAQLTPQ